MNADYNSLLRKWMGLVADHYELCTEAWNAVDIPPLDIEEGTEHLRELIFYVQDTLAHEEDDNDL